MKKDVCEVDSEGFIKCEKPLAKVHLENRSQRGIKFVASPETVFFVNGKEMFYEIGYLGPMDAFAIEEIDVAKGRGDYVAFAPNVQTLVNWLATERSIQAELPELERRVLRHKEQYERDEWKITAEIGKPLPNTVSMEEISRREALKKRDTAEVNRFLGRL